MMIYVLLVSNTCYTTSSCVTSFEMQPCFCCKILCYTIAIYILYTHVKLHKYIKYCPIYLYHFKKTSFGFNCFHSLPPALSIGVRTLWNPYGGLWEVVHSYDPWDWIYCKFPWIWFHFSSHYCRRGFHCNRYTVCIGRFSILFEVFHVGSREIIYNVK